MEHEEWRLGIPPVEPLDQFPADTNQFVPLILRPVGIGQIRHQGEVHVRIAVGEKPNLEIENQVPHLRFVQQQTRYGHHGRAFGRNAFRKIQLRQRARRNQVRHQMVHEIDRRLRGG